VTQASINVIVAGSTNSAYADWELRTTVTTATANWSFIDEDGLVYAQGPVISLTVAPHQFKPGFYKFRADAQVDVPANVPVNSLGTKYRIKWVLLHEGYEHTVYDAITVRSQEIDREGVVDVVDMENSTTRLSYRSALEDLSLTIKIYKNNTEQVNTAVVAEPIETTDGWQYYYDWSHNTSAGIVASMDALTVMFQYPDDTSQVRTEMGQMYVVNPSILQAARMLEQVLNQAYQDMGLQPFATLDQPTLLQYLRKGMDQFNGAVRPTNFTMTNAAGAIRQFWIGYSIVNACRAQQLAEGMRAFNFAGQSISLDVDRTQYWEQMASATLNDLDQQIKPFKDMLNKYGIFGGDGALINPTMGSIGAIGIRLNNLTPLRGGQYRNPGALFSW